MSTHKAEVVPVVLEKHWNAEKLSIVKIHGFSYCANTEEWTGKTKGIYLAPDTLCPTSRPEFSNLAPEAKSDGFYRVKAKKLRGVLSFGYMIPAPEEAQIGDDYWEKLGLEHYEPEVSSRTIEVGPNKKKVTLGGEVAKGPNVLTTKYDVENGRYYNNVFSPGDSVVLQEKVDGSNACYVYYDGSMHCKSRTEWKKEYADYSHITVEYLIEQGCDEEKAKKVVDGLGQSKKKKNDWWKVLDVIPQIRDFCEANPGLCLYGELVGKVGGFNYGYKPGEFGFLAFDVRKGNDWLDFEEAYEITTKFGVPWVPIIAKNFKFDFEKVCELAESQTRVPGANHIAEGIVVKSMKERFNSYLGGRSVLKWVACQYSEKKK